MYRGSILPMPHSSLSLSLALQALKSQPLRRLQQVLDDCGASIDLDRVLRDVTGLFPCAPLDGTLKGVRVSAYTPSNARLANAIEFCTSLKTNIHVHFEDKVRSQW